MKIAILGSSGHFGLAAEGLAGRESDLAMAPVEPGEDMAPVAGSLPAAVGFDDYARLLDGFRPDVAVVNPPFHRIGQVTRECLERGIHVFAEKPLATGWADYLGIRGLVTSAGPKLMAMLTMRYDGLFRAAHRLVSEGAIGSPVLLTAQKSYPLQGWDGGPRPAFYRKRSSYGGSIPWVGIHAIDLFQWFGGSAFTEVYAAQTLLGNGDNDELESAAVLHFKLASGALASASLDFLRPHPAGQGAAGPVSSSDGPSPENASPDPAAPDPWGDDRLRIAGDKGILEIRAGRLRLSDAGGAHEIDPEPGSSMFSAFLDWVEKGEPMLLSAQDCLRAAEAALRARDAADWGRVQTF